MSAEIITLPKSYLFYLEQENKAVFDSLANQSSPPPDFTWDDIDKFYKSKFSYEIIKYEYYFFLRELWKKTWGVALQGAESFLKECTEANYTYDEYSLDFVWGKAWPGWICKKFSCRDGILFTWVGEQDDRKGQYKLSFYIESGDKAKTYDVSANLRLDENLWHRAENIDRYTLDELWKALNKDSADISPLCNAAKNVADKLMQRWKNS